MFFLLMCRETKDLPSLDRVHGRRWGRSAIFSMVPRSLVACSLKPATLCRVLVDLPRFCPPGDPFASSSLFWFASSLYPSRLRFLLGIGREIEELGGVKDGEGWWRRLWR